MPRILFLLSVTACCYAASLKNDGNPNRPYRVEIQPSALSHWGDWGDKSFCPDNSWAQGYQLKVESDQGGLDDDTALDGVRLECFDSKGVYVGSVESSPEFSHSGEWMSKQYCTSNSFLDGIRLRSEEGYKKNKMYMESDKANTRGLDETAANNIDMHCVNKNTLSGNGMFWGEWTDWKYCPAGTAVCGLKTKVQEYSGAFTDDTALNEIILYCCDTAQTSTTTRRTTTTTTTRRTTTTTTTRRTTTTTRKPTVGTTTTTRKPTTTTSKPKTTTTRKPTAGTTTTTKVPTTTRQTTKTTTRKPTAGTTTTYRPTTTTGWHPPKNSRIAKLL